MKDNAMTIREQILAGTLVPDYADERFAPPPPPSSVPAFKGREIRYVPPPEMPAVDVIVADTLDRSLQTYKVSELVEQTTRAAVLFAVRRAKGNQSKATQILGINRNTLRNWCNKYGIDPIFYSDHQSKKAV